MSIAIMLRRLRDALIDAEWNGDGGLAAGLRKEIERLEMLQSMGETYDLPY